MLVENKIERIFMLSLDLPSTAFSEKIQLTSRILLIEDEELIRNMIALNLEEEGYEVIKANNGREALNILERQHLQGFGDNIDMVILDLMLPEVNGLDVCRLLRYRGNMIPILILSAKAAETDRVLGLEVGADDYLTKPFLLDELIIRIEALLRRPQQIERPAIKIGNLLFDSKASCFKRNGKELYLTRREYCLLEYLLRRKNEIVSRGEILENVWDYNADPFSNSIETHIASLRRKLNIGRQNDLIHTFSGRGYKLALKKMN